MSIRFQSICAFIPAAGLLAALTFATAPSFAQQPAPASQTPPSSPAAGQPAAQTPLALPPASKEPDYPDPRTFVIGIYGLYNPSYAGPDIRGGVQAGTTYESLFGIGQPYRISPQLEAGLPVTRTGMLYLDVERIHGSGSQVLTQDSFIDSFPFVKGDTIQSTYHVNTGRLYLDDLLYPHKFPVARLRFHSMWGIRYLGITHTVSSPDEDLVAGAPGTSFQYANSYIFYPEFGAAMEYAIAPHVLFRVEGSGFTFPHRATLADSEGTLAFRQKHVEVLVGVKTLHFKTSPKKEQYITGTFIQPFVGLRWHW